MGLTYYWHNLFHRDTVAQFKQQPKESLDSLIVELFAQQSCEEKHIEVLDGLSDISTPEELLELTNNSPYTPQIIDLPYVEYEVEYQRHKDALIHVETTISILRTVYERRFGEVLPSYEDFCRQGKGDL